MPLSLNRGARITMAMNVAYAVQLRIDIVESGLLL